MEVATALLLAFTIMLLHFLVSNSRYPSRFPKGPPRIPIIGSLPFLRGIGIEKFVGETVKEYGAIVGLYAGSYPTVVINDWYLAKKLFAKDIFSGRLSNYTTAWVRSTGGENLGIVTTDGDRWSTQRTFAMRHLKNFGLSKKMLDGCVLPQALETVQHLESLGEEEVVMDSSVFAVPVLNVIWSMMTSSSLERDNEEMVDLLAKLNFLFTSKIFMIASTLPWIRYVFPMYTGYNRRVDALTSIQAMLRRVIKEHEETLNIDHPRDLIDAYLTEKITKGDPEFSVDQLVMVGLDLMAAGLETTSTTLLWTVLYLVLYPEVQDRCYQEIAHSIGSADVSIAGAESLHFCQATIAEVQRLSAVAVASVMHRVTEQVEVEGYILPKDCLVLSNLQCFMSSPKLWEQPTRFNPSRFLNEAGELTKPEYFVPLGHGKRVCMGEILAKAELSLFFVTLLQHFKFESIPGFKPQTTNYTAGFTRIPKPYRVKITSRHV